MEQFYINDNVLVRKETKKTRMENESLDEGTIINKISNNAYEVKMANVIFQEVIHNI